MMVTVLLGLFVGVGWTRTPLPMKIASNSGYSMISSIRMLFDEPWNLHFSLLHSFFRLRARVTTRVLSNETRRRARKGSEHTDHRSSSAEPCASSHRPSSTRHSRSPEAPQPRPWRYARVWQAGA